MTKNATAAMTLVAAIPAAVLGFSLVSTFLTQLGNLSTMFTILAALTLLACAAVVFLPIGVMIFGPKSAAAAKPKGGAKDETKTRLAKDEEPKTGEVESASDEGDLGFGDEFGSEEHSTGELEVVEGGMTRDDIGAIDAPLSEAEIDAFPEEDFAFEEEEKPKKKKR